MDWNRYKPLVQADEASKGVRLRRTDRFELVSRVGSLEVLLVRPNSIAFTRRRAERVSRLSIREPIGDGGYGKPQFFADDPYQIVTALHAHALLLSDRARGIGIVVFERRSICGFVRWSDENSRYGDLIEQPGSTGWAVVHIWLMHAYRGRGLSAALLQVLVSGLQTSLLDLAWLPPFSRGGTRVLERLKSPCLWIADQQVPGGDNDFVSPFSAIVVDS